MPCSYPCLLDWNKQIWSVMFSLKFLLFLVEVSHLGCLLGGIGLRCIGLFDTSLTVS